MTMSGDAYRTIWGLEDIAEAKQDITPRELYDRQAAHMASRFQSLADAPPYVKKVFVRCERVRLLKSARYFGDSKTVDLLSVCQSAGLSLSDIWRFCRWAKGEGRSFLRTAAFLCKVCWREITGCFSQAAKYTYVIVAPNYDGDAGGSLVLHKLCDLINAIGHNAVLYPMGLCLGDWLARFRFRFYYFLGRNPLVTNLDWKSRYSIFLPRGPKIVVYPEIVIGNPLSAKNVVRFFLHNPGHFKCLTSYGNGELYFRYSHSFAEGYTPPCGSYISPHCVTVSVTPSCYNLNGAASIRQGSAYLIRKGKGKELVHDLQNSVKIDGFGHLEVSRIFKKVETFISYDPITAYSKYAVLCGCRSVVILAGDETVEMYYPLPGQRVGLCFGLDDFSAFTEANRKILEGEAVQEEKASRSNVQVFVDEADTFFSCVRDGLRRLGGD